MKRTALLSLVVLVALAGCVGSFGGPQTAASTDSPVTSTSETPTTEAPTTPYPDETAVFPSGPKSAPERPANPTAESVESYVLTYEFRHRYNELWSPDATVGLSEKSCSVRSVEEVQDGYTATVHCAGAYVNEPTGGPNSTATQHADYPPWTVRYYVDEDSLIREELD
ncbi:hypothetical protein [Halogeometricum limi]|uniref:Lipoprotein n=1 Tax=Halogeometricum limi TaxID=555875 RepID=A0A1I6II31_9EURY|nr:hypothetical protein [Halogeometricum limi]SFR66447.1 hypothetical protein SAMN04488124_3246 [Halogeometricum limi]